MPDLREAIWRLIRDLVIADQQAVLSVEGRDHQNGGSKSSGRDDGRNDSGVSSSAVIVWSSHRNSPSSCWKSRFVPVRLLPLERMSLTLPTGVMTHPVKLTPSLE